MSEPIPPTGPEKEIPKPLITSDDTANEPPSKGLFATLGVFLLLGSLGFSFVFPPLCLVGLAVAVASLFLKGYRYIFIGYILTLLLGTGLIVLALIVICGNSQDHFWG